MNSISLLKTWTWSSVLSSTASFCGWTHGVCSGP